MTAAKLFFWGARGLYLGQAFGLRAHRNAVAVLCVSLDLPAQLACNPLRRTAGHVSFRSALIPPNTLHHLCSPDGNRMAFLYVDALSEDCRQLRAAMRSREPRFSLGHVAEAGLIGTLLELAAGKRWPDARDELSDLLGLAEPAHPDTRIVEAIERLHASPGDDHRLVDMAQDAQLSPSHFLHLFKAETGVPFRRYRTWARMGAALKAVRGGRSLTEAAHAAGFSSSAHFSSAFAQMFGLPPSRLASTAGAAAVAQVALHS
jgi:AraC-like DNA-binding protein